MPGSSRCASRRRLRSGVRRGDGVGPVLLVELEARRRYAARVGRRRSSLGAELERDRPARQRLARRVLQHRAEDDRLVGAARAGAGVGRRGRLLGDREAVHRARRVVEQVTAEHRAAGVGAGRRGGRAVGANGCDFKPFERQLHERTEAQAERSAGRRSTPRHERGEPHSALTTRSSWLSASRHRRASAQPRRAVRA